MIIFVDLLLNLLLFEENYEIKPNFLSLVQ
jgi:hypothetical protein